MRRGDDEGGLVGGGPPELAEALVESYLEWRECAIAVQLAYEDWLEAAEGVATRAFRSYCAALDREERASFLYAALVAEAAASDATAPAIYRERR